MAEGSDTTPQMIDPDPDMGTDTAGAVRRFMACGTLFPQKHPSQDAFTEILKKLPHTLTNDQQEMLLAGADRAIAAYATAVARKTQRIASERAWRSEDRAALKRAASLAGKLCETLSSLPSEAVRAWGPGASEVFVEAQRSAENARVDLGRTLKLLPKLSPNRAFWPEHEVFVERLMSAWLKAMGEAANRSPNKDGFCYFAELVAAMAKVKITRSQIEEAISRIKSESAGE